MADDRQASGGFKAPGNPAIPQDLALIMEMVGVQQGAMERVGTASEARAAIEQSSTKPMAAAVETQSDSDSSDSETSVGSSDDADAMVEADSDADSDSDAGVTTSAPMSAGTHAHLLSQLTSFVQGGSSSGPVNNVADSDDEDFILSEPLATEHEVPLPTVQAPPIERVPDDEKRVLAGAVMSWMPAKGVIEWLRTQADDKEADEVAADIMLAEEEEEKAPEVEAASEVKEEIATPSDDAVKESATTSSLVPATTTTTAEPQASSSKLDKGKGKASSKFPSSGTVVIRAIHNPQASAGDGWLEEGSLLCWEDGRVLGTVSETFGPLTSPFYQVRVAPPPFPFPSPESLEPGTKLYYPHTSQYRSFVPVRMLQTDPRLKGSDASNRYDEEVGEDEMEWSDDEMEAAAKRGKKQRKGKGARQGSAAPSASGGFQHPLPPRPHFDHEGGDDEPLLYDEMDAGSDWGGSEAGSTAGGRARPAPYEVDDASAADAVPRRGQEERRGRGRGGKPSRGRGGRPQQNNGPSSLPPRPSQAATGPPAGFGQGAPQFQPQPQFPQQQFMPQQFPYQQQMPGFGGYYPNPQQQQFMMMMQHQQQQQQYGYHPQAYGFMPQQHAQQPVQQQQQQQPSAQQQQQQPVAPAINPRFAAQYQHMMSGGPQAGSAPPSDGQQ